MTLFKKVFIINNQRGSNSECYGTVTRMVFDKLDLHWHGPVAPPIAIKVRRNLKEGLHFDLLTKMR